jgi:hypothetical protein
MSVTKTLRDAACRWKPYEVFSARLCCLGIPPGLALAFVFPVTACFAETEIDSDAPDPEAKSSVTSPTLYFDFSTTFARAPGNSFVIARRGFFSITGSSSKTITFDAPLTLDLTDDLSVYAGFDAGCSKIEQTPWAKLSIGNFTSGFDYTFVEQSKFLPELSVFGSVSRPVNLPAGTPLTTTWSGGIDVDFALDDDGDRGLLAGLAVTHVAVNSSSGRVLPVYGGYVGAYYQWETGWKLTGKTGYAAFGGANLGALIQAAAVQQIFATLELEKYDDADNKIVGIGLAAARTVGSSTNKGTTIQLVLSFPIYLARSQ